MLSTIRAHGLLAGFIALAVIVSGAAAADERPVKIAVVSSSTWSNGIGRHVLDGIALAIEEGQGKFGKYAVEIFAVNVEGTANQANQIAFDVASSNRFPIVVTAVPPNMFAQVRKPFTDSGAVVIAATEVPSQFAGGECKTDTFSVVMAPNSFAGSLLTRLGSDARNQVFALLIDSDGGRRTEDQLKQMYQERLLGSALIDPSSEDLSVAISRIVGSRPDALIVQLPGPIANRFIDRFVLAGFDGVPIYSVETADEVILRDVSRMPPNWKEITDWTSDIDGGPFFGKFVRKFGYHPSRFAAYGYDAGKLSEAALSNADPFNDAQGFRKVVGTVKFPSLRKNLSLNKNGFPREDIWAANIVRGPVRGQITRVETQVGTDVVDEYVKSCPPR